MKNLSIFTGLLALLGLAWTSGPAATEESMTSIVELWAQSAHADAASEAFTHWNDAGEIPGQCALCHAGAGFRAFYGLDQSMAGGISAPMPTGGVIDCDTCHVKGAREISEVGFPSGKTLSPPANNGTCFTCHQGRQSGLGVAAAIEGMAPDEVNPDLAFLNPHYALAAATLFGSEVGGAFEFQGKAYHGRYTHAPSASTCTDCHSPHGLAVQVETCITCHNTDVVADIRRSPQDFDQDGDTVEGIAGEIDGLNQRLGVALADYANNIVGAPLIYSSGAYPYFFNDTNANGAVDEGEAAFPNRYSHWTPRLLTSAYNYQFVGKDPGSFAHNPQYVLQILIDSIENLTGETGLTELRPQ